MKLRRVLPLGAAVAVLLVPVLAATPASAATTPTLAPAELTALQRDLGLSAVAAQARAESENAAARTDEALRARLGAAYVGSWLDPTTGRLTVRTADAASAAAVTAAGADAVVTQARLDPRPGKDKLDKAAKRAPRSVASWYVDDAASTVVVEATDDAAARSFVAQSGAAGDRVVVRTVAQAPELFFDLVGGQAITSGGRCSIGFSARSGSLTYVVTAGHCTAGSGTWAGYNGVTIGPAVAKNFPTDDFGTIRVTSGQWTGTSRVEGTTSVLGSTEAAVGAGTCRSGSTTGYRCGVIQAKNATVNYGAGNVVYGLTKTSACAERGDSGGSYVSGRQAQGMTSSGSGDCRVGGTTYFQPVNEALQRTGLTLVTG